MLPEASAPVLREYVRQGGALVTEARLAWNNERGLAAERVPGMGLWEVMGARELAVETAPNGRTTLQWTGTGLPGLDGERLPARWYKETLEPLSAAAHVVARFEDGAAAAVMSTYGRGRTLLLGSYVSAAYQTTPTADTARFYRALLDWAGVSRPVTVSGATLEVRVLESRDEAVLFVFNHDRAAARSEVTLRRPAGSRAAADLVRGGSIPLTRTAEGVTISIEVPPSDVRVVRLTMAAPE
jgi:hypothetical protein